MSEPKVPRIEVGKLYACNPTMSICSVAGHKSPGISIIREFLGKESVDFIQRELGAREGFQQEPTIVAWIDSGVKPADDEPVTIKVRAESKDGRFLPKLTFLASSVLEAWMEAVKKGPNGCLVIEWKGHVGDSRKNLGDGHAPQGASDIANGKMEVAS